MAKFTPNPKFLDLVVGKNSKVEKGLLAAGIFLVGKTSRLISGQGSGEVYEVRGGERIIPFNSDPRPKGRSRGPIHVASAPGEPPAVLFGKLRQSLAFRVENEGAFRGVVLKIGANVPYARRLEFGDPDADFAPRPFFRPTLKRNFKKVLGIFAANAGFKLKGRVGV